MHELGDDNRLRKERDETRAELERAKQLAGHAVNEIEMLEGRLTEQISRVETLRGELKALRVALDEAEKERADLQRMNAELVHVVAGHAEEVRRLEAERHEALRRKHHKVDRLRWQRDVARASLEVLWANVSALVFAWGDQVDHVSGQLADERLENELLEAAVERQSWRTAIARESLEALWRDRQALEYELNNAQAQLADLERENSQLTRARKAEAERLEQRDLGPWCEACGARCVGRVFYTEEGVRLCDACIKKLEEDRRAPWSAAAKREPICCAGVGIKPGMLLGRCPRCGGVRPMLAEDAQKEEPITITKQKLTEAEVQALSALVYLEAVEYDGVNYNRSLRELSAPHDGSGQPSDAESALRAELKRRGVLL